MLALLVSLAAQQGLYSSATAAVQPAVTLFWCSTGISPGETLLCAVGDGAGGGGVLSAAATTAPRDDTHNLTLRLTAADAATVMEVPAVLSPSAGAVSAVLPPGSSLAAGSHTLQLLSSGRVVSNRYVLNAPEIWWVQGDLGETASPGGWLRVFGRGLVIPGAQNNQEAGGGRCSACEAQEIGASMAAAGRRADWERVAELAGRAQRLALQRRAQLPPQLSTTVNLTWVGEGHPALLITASPQRLSAYSAEFAVPAGTRSGEYELSLSNGQAATSLAWFESPQHPAKKTIEVTTAANRADSDTVFRVADFGCIGGIERTNSKDLTSATPVDCTAAVAKALAAAAKVSPAPSTVLFGPGRWYLQPPLSLPTGVTIQGSSMATTALYFAQTSSNGTDAQNWKEVQASGPPALVGPLEQHRITTFGVRDLCIYALSFYSTVVNISANTNNVEVRRVRIRANAFNGRNNAERRVPWQGSIGGNGPPVILLQGRSSVVSDCDIYATWLAIASHGDYGGPPRQHGEPASARFALVRNNTIWNGGACFWADQVKEVIFEENTCSGISPMSGGNNVATYGGGYAQHVFWGANSVRNVWGNDREVMTFDNRGNQYFGAIASVSADGTNVTTYGRGAFPPITAYYLYLV
jgi:hypothetical protein